MKLIEKSNLSKVKTDFFISFCVIQARGIFRDRIQFPEKSEIHYPHSLSDATCPLTQINNISYYHLLRGGSKYSTYIQSVSTRVIKPTNSQSPKKTNNSLFDLSHYNAVKDI